MWIWGLFLTIRSKRFVFYRGCNRQLPASFLVAWPASWPSILLDPTSTNLSAVISILFGSRLQAFWYPACDRYLSFYACSSSRFSVAPMGLSMIILWSLLPKKLLGRKPRDQSQILWQKPLGKLGRLNRCKLQILTRSPCNVRIPFPWLCTRWTRTHICQCYTAITARYKRRTYAEQKEAAAKLRNKL